MKDTKSRVWIVEYKIPQGEWVAITGISVFGDEDSLRKVFPVDDEIIRVVPYVPENHLDFEGK